MAEPEQTVKQRHRRLQRLPTTQNKETPEVPDEKSTALTVVKEPPPVRLRPLPALPTADGIRGMRELANEICKTEFVPQGFRGRPDAVLAAFAYGRELGFQPMTALKYLDNIQGQITVKPRAMSALIRSAGHTLSYPEATATKCTVYGKRRDTGEEMTVTWTIEQAKRAGLVRDGSGWTKYPEDMLVARATGTIGRRLFEDVVLGLYTPEEMGGEPDESEIIEGKTESVAQPSLAQVITKPKEETPSETPPAAASSPPASSPTTTSSASSSPPAATSSTPSPSTSTASTSPTPTPPLSTPSAATATPPSPTPTPEPESPAFGADRKVEQLDQVKAKALELAKEATLKTNKVRYPTQEWPAALVEAKAKMAITQYMKQRLQTDEEHATAEQWLSLVEAINVTLDNRQ